MPAQRFRRSASLIKSFLLRKITQDKVFISISIKKWRGLTTYRKPLRLGEQKTALAPQRVTLPLPWRLVDGEPTISNMRIRSPLSFFRVHTVSDPEFLL